MTGWRHWPWPYTQWQWRGCLSLPQSLPAAVPSYYAVTACKSQHQYLFFIPSYLYSLEYLILIGQSGGHTSWLKPLQQRPALLRHFWYISPLLSCLCSLQPSHLKIKEHIFVRLDELLTACTVHGTVNIFMFIFISSVADNALQVTRLT